MIKIPVKKAKKRLVCWLGPALLFFKILILIFDFGSEKLPGLTRNEPRDLFLESPDNVSAPKSCFVFVVFAFKIKVPIILKMISE